MNGEMTDNRETVLFPARPVPVAHKVDVLVVGGGTSGTAAAVASARQGAATMLVERYGFLGGTAVICVPHYQEGPKVRGEPVIRGIYAEQKARLAEYNAIRGEFAGLDLEPAGIVDRLGSYTASSGRFDPAMLQLVYLDMCEEAGVRLLLHTYLVDTLVTNGTVSHAVFVNKGGLVAVEAKQFIDTTADGDLAVAAGARAETGRPKDGLTEPPSLAFHLANVDLKKLESADLNALWPLFEAEVPGGPPRGRIRFRRLETEGRLFFNQMHILRVNAADPADRSNLEIIGRRQAKAVMEFFRRHVPGCEHCTIDVIATEAGVRESRRVIGDYVMTRADILGCRKFPDSIGCATTWIDMHDPEGVGCRHDYLPGDDWFEVPYRALITVGLNNLYTASRCVSSTHEALGGLRSIPVGIMMGEAAGTAAALCAREGIAARELDIIKLQQALVKAGVFIGSAQGIEAAPPQAT